MLKPNYIVNSINNWHVVLIDENISSYTALDLQSLIGNEGSEYVQGWKLMCTLFCCVWSLFVTNFKYVSSGSQENLGKGAGGQWGLFFTIFTWTQLWVHVANYLNLSANYWLCDHIGSKHYEWGPSYIPIRYRVTKKIHLLAFCVLSCTKYSFCVFVMWKVNLTFYI